MIFNGKPACAIAAVLLVSLLFSGCAGMRLVPSETVAVQRTIDVQGSNRDKIFDASKLWISRKIPADSKGTDVVDRQAGLIIYHGIVPVPTTALTEIIENRLIRFTLREEIKDGHVRLTFDNITLVSPEAYNHSTWSGGHERQVRTPEELSQVRYVLGSLAAGLEKHLNDGGTW